MTTSTLNTRETIAAILLASFATACVEQAPDTVPVEFDDQCPTSDGEEYIPYGDVCWRVRADIDSDGCWTTVRETITYSGEAVEPWSQLCGVECAFYYLDETLVADQRCEDNETESTKQDPLQP